LQLIRVFLNDTMSAFNALLGNEAHD
jgi:hypothetical protein